MVGVERGEEGRMWGECGRGGGGWVSLFLSGGVEFVYITVQTYLTWLALLDVDVEVVWCGGGVEDVLGAGVDLGARRSSESARLLQSWQKSLTSLPAQCTWGWGGLWPAQILS